jgi:hypothetical protein
MPVRTSCPQCWGIAACCAPVAAEYSMTFFVWEHVLLFERGKESVDKDGDYLEN